MRGERIDAGPPVALGVRRVARDCHRPQALPVQGDDAHAPAIQHPSRRRGQPPCHGEVALPLIRPPELRHILHDHDRAADVPGRVAQRGPARADADLAPIEDTDLHLDGVRAGQRLAPQDARQAPAFLRERPALRVARRPFVRRRGDGIGLGGEAQDGAGRPICPQDAAVAVVHEQAIRHGVDDGVEAPGLDPRVLSALLGRAGEQLGGAPRPLDAAGQGAQGAAGDEEQGQRDDATLGVLREVQHGRMEQRAQQDRGHQRREQARRHAPGQGDERDH